jgi:anti-sigma regulatory factor (Ser/Thr protein kinase)
MEREFRVSTTEVAAGLDGLEAALRDARVSAETVLDLRLVAEEILTNVAKYAHDDGGPHEVRMRLALEAGAATLEFSDDGRPFDPLAAPPPDGDAREGGLGLPLVRALVDDAAYTRRDSWNVLTLRKRLPGPDGRVP